MSGVNGASKLNIVAPRKSVAETKVTVSAVVVPEKSEKQPEIEVLTANLTEEETEVQTEEINLQPQEIANEETPVEAIEVASESATGEEIANESAVANSPSEEVVLSPTEETEIPKEPILERKFNVNGILMAYAELESQITRLYIEVFSKTRGFKPSCKQTIADAFNFVYSLLHANGYSLAFERAFGLTGVTPKSFEEGYIPYCVKLSKWAEDKGLITICEDVLSALTTLYIESALSFGKTITEEGVTETFSALLNFVF